MDKGTCKECAVDTHKCECYTCLQFYIACNKCTESCYTSIMRLGCGGFNTGRRDHNGNNYCLPYDKIDWVMEIKYSKKIEDVRKKLRSL